MNKLFLILIFGILMIGLIGAESLGTYGQGDNVRMKQVCDACSCTYNNITLSYPDSTEALKEVSMKKDSCLWYYDFNDTLKLGTYNIAGHGDENGIDTTWGGTLPDGSSYGFLVSSSGNSGSSNVAFIIFVILLIYAIGFIGFFYKNMTISLLGGLAMVGLGVYMINQGIIIYRDDITNILSYTTIGIGAFFSLVPIVEWIEENF